MTPEGLFALANPIAAAGWLLLIAGPRHPRVMAAAGTWIPLLLSATYLLVLAVHWGDANGSFSSLQGVSDLFANRWLLLAGWVHYLAFDLFVGAWEARDAARRGVSRILLAPCLVLTFLFGPVGLVLYHVIRAAAPVRHTREVQQAPA
jgi:hypothetical protein